LIEMLDNWFVLIPTNLKFQFPVDPVFSFRKNMKAVDGFNTPFIERFIVPE